MDKKALVVIDIQNDITKHYRDIIDNINAPIDWAMDLTEKRRTGFGGISSVPRRSIAASHFR